MSLYMSAHVKGGSSAPPEPLFLSTPPPPSYPKVQTTYLKLNSSNSLTPSITNHHGRPNPIRTNNGTLRRTMSRLPNTRTSRREQDHGQSAQSLCRRHCLIRRSANPHLQFICSILTVHLRNDPRQLQQQSRLKPNLHILPTPRPPHHAQHRHNAPPKTRPHLHLYDTSTRPRADRRGEHTDRRVESASEGCVAGG